MKSDESGHAGKQEGGKPLAPKAASAVPSDDEHWTGRIRERARELGLTDAQVARRLGLAQSRYSNYTNRIREPDLAMFARICRTLNTSPDVVLGFADLQESSDDDRLKARGAGALAVLSGRELKMAVQVIETILEALQTDEPAD